MTSRTRIAGIDAVFGVEKIDGSDEEEENEEKSDVELLLIFPGHEIPRALI
jgi:hypothetical protein